MEKVAGPIGAPPSELIRWTLVISLLNVLVLASLTAIGGFLPVPVPYATWGTPILPGAHELMQWRAVSAGTCMLSLQVPAVWVSGWLLGPRLGLASQVILLLVGLAGLPIFAGGGGLHYASEPTFGYLLGFLPAVTVIGAFTRKGWRARPLGAITWTAAGLLLGQAAMWTVGLIWQAIVLGGRPAIWRASAEGTLQLAVSYVCLMAVLVAAQALLAATRQRRPVEVPVPED